MDSDLFTVIAAMSVRDLHKELRERGIDTAACIEKADLVHLLVSNWEAPQPQPAARSAAGTSRVQQGPPRGTLFLCQACGRPDGVAGGKLLNCSKCNWAHYCSKECQVAAWPAHKSRCKELQAGKQVFADRLGTEVATAFNAWIKRIRPLLIDVAAAVLWPAPHLPPRNRSHGLRMFVSYDDSTKPPRFKVDLLDELELGELDAWMARANGGEAFRWPLLAPDPDPGLEVMKVAVMIGQGGIVRGMHLCLSGALVSQLRDGTWELPSVEETFAKIKMLA